jgi:hypothetical protein
MLLLYTPGGFEGFFAERAAAESVRGGSLQPDELDAIGPQVRNAGGSYLAHRALGRRRGILRAKRLPRTEAQARHSGTLVQACAPAVCECQLWAEADIAQTTCSALNL